MGKLHRYFQPEIIADIFRLIWLGISILKQLYRRTFVIVIAEECRFNLRLL